VPREPRIYIEKVLYFITARGAEGRRLFNDPQDFDEYLTSLREYKQEYGFRLFAFALLPKHLCLLIELRNNVTISTIMHNLNSKYTKAYNSRYGKRGHLFQSRFKSILIEKDDYLLRLSRYIHLLPKDSEVTGDSAEYPYSSYAQYVSDSADQRAHSRMPDMADEIKEVLSHLTQKGTDIEKQKAYEGYVQSADDEEMEIVRKLLHRTAFVGSKDFCREIRNRIKHHIIEEEESRIVRKTNPVFVLTGSLIILFLGTVAYNFYKNQSTLQATLNVTASGFETARKDLVERMNLLETEITGYEQKENHGLGGFAWELQLTPVQEKKRGQTFKDQLQFKGGKVVSSELMARGFSPFDYTVSKQSHGKMIWQTAQTNTEGLTVRWYGIVAGDKMRGVLSEQDPAQKTSRDFSFVSIRRVNQPRGMKRAVQ